MANPQRKKSKRRSSFGRTRAIVLHGPVRQPPTPEAKREQAIRAWLQISRHDRLQIVRQVVETRGDELRRAYPQVVQVMAGLKRARNRKKDQQFLERPQPAVIFVVREKRAERALASDDVIRPLRQYCNVRGKNKLCEIPIDVEEVSSFAAIRPSTSQQVSVNGSLGAVCCAVDVPISTPPMLAAVSCRHLFTDSGMSVEVGGTRLGMVSSHIGTLDPANGTSLDVALALGVDRFALQSALGGMRIDVVARGHDDMPAPGATYYVLTSDGALPATYRGDYPSPINYPKFGSVRQIELLLSRMMDSEHLAVEGYSGCPVVTRKNGGMLLGMHIAGDGDSPSFGDKAIMVPIWHVLQCGNYSGLPKGKRLAVVERID